MISIANEELRAGVDSYLLYGEESTYQTAVTVDTHFGLVQSVNPVINRNLIEHKGFAGSTSGGRKTAKTTAGTFDGRLTVELQPQLFDWLQYLLGGTRTGSGTVADPYSYPVGNDRKSLTIGHNLNNDTTDREETYRGCVMDSATLRASVGEPVTCTLNFLFGNMAKDTTLSTNTALSTEDPYTFAGGSIELPDGAALPNIIDSVDITITNNYEQLYGLGSYTSVNAKPKGLQITVRFTVKYVDETLLDDILGSSTTVGTPTENATMAVKFTRGTDEVDFVFTAVTFNEWNEAANLNEFINEDMTAIAEDVTVGEIQNP